MKNTILVALAGWALTASSQAQTPILLGPCEILEYRPYDLTLSTGWGRAMAASDSFVLVGASSDLDMGIASGAVYSYRTVGELLASEFKFHASDASQGAKFGHDIATVGNLALVSAPFAGFGDVYAFERQGNQWVETQKLTGSATSLAADFGTSVDMDSTRALIGAPGDGTAYIFERTGSTWSETAILSGSHLDDFGESVAIEGTRAFVGAPRTTVGSATLAGSVTYYRFLSGIQVWVPFLPLTASNASMNSKFGTSIGFDGLSLVVGAPFADTPLNNRGAAYVFDEVSLNTWVEQDMLVASDGSTQAEFGHEVEISSGRILVGAPGASSAYLFEEQGSSWSEVFPIDDLAGPFGDGMALTASRAFVADWSETAFIPTTTSGKFLSYALTGQDCNANGTFDVCDIGSGTSTDVNFNSIPDDCECGVENYCTSVPNSAASPAVISVTSTPSISAGSMTLQAGPVPNEPGIFFYSESQNFAPFGPGFLCVGGASQIVRLLPPVFASGNVLSKTVPLSDLPTGTPGPFEVINFQAWFRDTANLDGFNTSDAIEITFCP